MNCSVRGRASCGRDGLFEHCLSTTSVTGRITSIWQRRAQARLAVVLAARGQRCDMESIDRCA